MKSIKNIFSTLVMAAFALLATPIYTAHAQDIPVLTWEAGKEHNVELGGYPGKSEWKIQLIPTDKNSTAKTLVFSKSITHTAKNVYFYAVNLPDNYAVGNYTIKASGYANLSSTVAVVKVIPLAYYQITEMPFDLLVVMGFFIFFTAALAVLRARKFSQISYIASVARRLEHEKFIEDAQRRRLGKPTEEAEFGLNSGLTNTYVDEIIEEQQQESDKPSFAARYRFYLHELTETLSESLFKTIVSRERSQLALVAPKAWSSFPIIAVVIGIGLSLLQRHDGGIATAPMWIYFIGALIGLIDLFSGTLAFSSFFLIQLFFGHAQSFREVMAMAAIGFAFVGPALISAIFSALGDTTPINFDELKKVKKYPIAFYVGAIVGGAAFYVGMIVSYSLHITVNGNTGVALLYPTAIALLIVGKNTIIDQQITAMSHSEIETGQVEIVTINVGRVISPFTFFVLFASLTGTFYIWVESMTSALGIAALLSIPYIFMFIQITEIRSALLLRIKRNWFVEALIVLILSIAFFLLVEKLPLNVLQRSHLFLFLAIVPLVLHAIFSAIWDGAERNTDRIIAVEESELEI